MKVKVHASIKEHPLFTLCGKRTRDIPDEEITLVLLHSEDAEEVNCPSCKMKIGLELLKNDSS